MRKAQEHVEGGGREEEIIELRLKLKKKETKPIRAQRGSDQIGTSQGRADWRLGAGANQSLIPGGAPPHSGDITWYDWLTRRHGTRGCVEPWMASCTVSIGVALTENGLASLLIYTEHKNISMEYTPYTLLLYTSYGSFSFFSSLDFIISLNSTFVKSLLDLIYGQRTFDIFQIVPVSVCIHQLSVPLQPLLLGHLSLDLGVSVWFQIVV